MVSFVLKNDQSLDFDVDAETGISFFGKYLRGHQSYFSKNEYLQMDPSMNGTDDEYAVEFLKKWEASGVKQGPFGKRRMIHPMYVLLQEESPTTRKDFELKEVDSVIQPMSLSQFYSEHVSRSVPLIFRREVAQTKLTNHFDAIEGNDLDLFLVDIFSTKERE